MSTRELLTTSQAAKRLGVGRTTVVNLVNRGMLYPEALVSVTRHGSYVFTPDEVERVREQREAGIK
jgi:transposase